MSQLSAKQIATIAMSTDDNVNIQRDTINTLYRKQNHLIDGVCVLADIRKVNITEVALQRVSERQPMDLFAFDAMGYAQDVENTIASVVLETHERPDLY